MHNSRGDPHHLDMSAESEQQLVEKFRHGDDEAFTSPYRRHEADVYGFLLRRVGNEDDADELLQKTMVAVARMIAQDALTFTSHGDSSFVRLTKTIAHRRFVDWLRQQLRRPMHVSWDETDGESGNLGSLRDSGDQPDDILVKNEERKMLLNAIGELRENLREVAIRVYLDGLTPAETAEALDLELSNVKSLLFRAREELRPKLDKIEGLFGRYRDRGLARRV